MEHNEENMDLRKGYKLSGELVSYVDPYVVQTLQSIVGKYIVVDTVRGSIRGMLKDVKPDHIVVAESEDAPFFIRIQQIVWIMPEQ